MIILQNAMEFEEFQRIAVYPYDIHHKQTKLRSTQHCNIEYLLIFYSFLRNPETAVFLLRKWMQPYMNHYDVDYMRSLNDFPEKTLTPNDIKRQQTLNGEYLIASISNAACPTFICLILFDCVWKNPGKLTYFQSAIGNYMSKS